MYFQPLLKGLAIIFSFGHKKTLSSEFSDTHQKAPRKLVGINPARSALLPGGEPPPYRAP